MPDTLIVIVRCPNCRLLQKYQARKKDSLRRNASFVGKHRKCVFCGKPIPIYKDVNDNNVVRTDVKPDEPADKKNYEYLKFRVRPI